MKEHVSHEGTKMIRNSAQEFLIFKWQVGERGIEARYEAEAIWLSQKVMAAFEQLNEYRTALINSAVTGKIDVSTALNTVVSKRQ